MLPFDRTFGTSAQNCAEPAPRVAFIEQNATKLLIEHVEVRRNRSLDLLAGPTLRHVGIVQHGIKVTPPAGYTEQEGQTFHPKRAKRRPKV
jgi:hypothetical protein